MKFKFVCIIRKDKLGNFFPDILTWKEYKKYKKINP